MLPKGRSETTLGDCQGRTVTVDPRAHESELFDLYSVPSYSEMRPDVITGGEIGSTKQEVCPGDVLLCKIVPHIRRGWAVPAKHDRRQIASGEWIVLRDHGLEAEYLRRFVLSDGFHAQFMQTVSGVGGSLMRARPADAGKIAVLVPPLAEQRRIVAKLDALTARLARARAELERSTVLAKELRLSSLNRTLAVAASDVPRVKFSDKLSILTSGSHDWTKYYGAGSSVFVLASNVRQFYFDPTPRQYVDPPLNSPDARRSRILKNDLLVTIVGAGTGDICRVSKDLSNYFVCQSVARAALKDERLAAFYAYWFAAPEHGRAAFEAAMYGAARPHLSFDHLKGFIVPDIDAESAQAAVRQIDAAFARADRLETEAARAKALLDRLEAAVLAKAFRGELVPQDPADEPASVLLDRIRAERAAVPKAKRGRRAAATSAGPTSAGGLP